MAGWEVWFLAGIIQSTGALAGPSNGTTLLLIICAAINFAVAVVIKAVS